MGRLSQSCGQVAVLAVLGSLLAGCAGLRLPWFDSAQGDGVTAVQPSGEPAAMLGGLASVRIRVAENALRNRDFGTAERLFREAQEAAPGAFAPLVGLGEAIYAQGRYDEAVASFQAALARDVQSREASEGLARALIAKGNPVEARRVLEAVPRAQATAPFLNKLGVARDLAGDGPAAQDAYRAALALEPENLSVRNNLALSLAISGKSDEAAREMEQVVGAAGTDPRYRANLSFVYGLGGNFAALERLGGTIDPVERGRLDARYAQIRALAAAGDRATVLTLAGQTVAEPKAGSPIAGGKVAEETEKKRDYSRGAGAAQMVSIPVPRTEDASPPAPSQGGAAPRSAAIVPAEAEKDSVAPDVPAAKDRSRETTVASREEPAVESPPRPVAEGITGAGAPPAWRVQLAAYRTLAHAARGRAIFQRELGDLLPGIEALERREVRAGPGGIAFRLRTVPLADHEAAVKLCTALEDLGLSCLIVRHTAELWTPTG